ncbi:MAG: membrane protein insertion efficiency factor YidD [Rhabdochlamydiaceae bacterium]|nr:membrane protein insertion efficiency factor YidD [Rhabdochlamydiaceae bacterium]
MVFRILFFLCPILVFAIPGYHPPWGKDADLSYHKPSHSPSADLSPLGGAMEKLIWFHQNIISPVDGPRSHFKPSSSTYMMQAIRKHGFFKGYIMGCDRLLRENEAAWVYRTTVIEGQTWKIDPP